MSNDLLPATSRLPTKLVVQGGTGPLHLSSEQLLMPCRSGNFHHHSYCPNTLLAISDGPLDVVYLVRTSEPSSTA